MEKLTEAAKMEEVTLTDYYFDEVKSLKEEIEKLRKDHVEELLQREIEYRNKTKQLFRQNVRGLIYFLVDSYRRKRIRALLALSDDEFSKVWNSGKVKHLFG
jgi:hypothetical protein